MADIVDLKRTPADKKEIEAEFDRSFSESDYPYGLNLSFQDTEIRKLNIGEMDVGDEVTITATAKISSKSFREVEGGKPDGNMGIQITGMAVEKANTTSAAQKLYGDSGNDDKQG